MKKNVRPKSPFHRKTILITSGPTREYLDPVRFISNDSSGRMGRALADEAVRRGASVVWVTGSPDSGPRPGIKTVPVVTTEEMSRECRRHLRRADVVIGAAAVCDWTPVRKSRHKIKKGPRTRLTVRLRPTEDILRRLSSLKRPGTVVGGFALETQNLLKNARRKMADKRLDFIVANDASAIGASESSACFLDRRGATVFFPRSTKTRLARRILGEIASRWGNG
ncbi:MAG TPA: phosphopantothenoylcysteine decarboxylase [Elusimicrobiota bacterium]|nr:phosphopantothenoylcysteine decarboxylase [Elusimicrobiota bacterium]